MGRETLTVYTSSSNLYNMPFYYKDNPIWNTQVTVEDLGVKWTEYLAKKP